MKKIISILIALVLCASFCFVSAEGLLGGWKIAENNEITEDVQTLFDKAIEKLIGVSYEPIAYLASQTVAGTNHCILCRATVIYPDAQPTLKLVFIYEDLQGNTEITNIADFDIAMFAVVDE